MGLKQKMLNDDPAIALREISSYLKAVRTDSGRRIYSCGHGETVGQPCSNCRKEDIDEMGYWQTTEYLDGLLELAGEIDDLVGGIKSKTSIVEESLIDLKDNQNSSKVVHIEKVNGSLTINL